MKVNNLEFNVRIQGGGMPFIWGHGLMMDMAHEDRNGLFDWDDVASIATIVRYDARGHGETGATYRSDDYVWPAFSKDMLALADVCGFEKFIAGGHSMGSAVALYTALHAPDRINGLILANSPRARSWETPLVNHSVYDTMMRIIETEGLAQLLRIMRAAPLIPRWQREAKPAMVENYLHSIGRFDVDVLIPILQGTKRCRFPSRESIAGISVPVLILAWTEDAVHPLATAKDLHRLLPNSRLVVAKNLEEVAAWGIAIREFIADIMVCSDHVF